MTIGKLRQRIVILVVIMGAVFFLFLSIYSLVISTGPCRDLRELAQNNESSTKILNSLSDFLSRSNVQSTLTSTAGFSFSLNEFSSSLDLRGIGLDIDPSIAQLYIKSSRMDKRFEPPFNIDEIGIGYSRSYLVYKNEIREGVNTMFEVQLDSNPRVVCGE